MQRDWIGRVDEAQLGIEKADLARLTFHLERNGLAA